MDNQLYSYTSMTEIIASLMSPTPGWLRIKQGQTISQSIDVRVSQQDNAANTSDLITLSKYVVENNTDPKLDDKVRNIQHRQKYFKKYIRFNHGDKKHEWSLVRIDDILEKIYSGGFEKFHYDFLMSKNKEVFLNKNLLTNSSFLTGIDDRIYQSKNEAVKELLNKTLHKCYDPRHWQAQVIAEMLAAGKKYNLLSLAPRFGKTLTVLEYVKQLGNMTKQEYILIPASKNLSSNSSFVNDYREFGYYNHFDIIDNASLFRDEDKIIEILGAAIPKNKSVIIVTDEADIASHTTISREKIQSIHANFNVAKQISMSGTGIHKAAKIFRGIPDEDIFFKSINYTELMAYNSNELVKRNFYNIQLDTENIRQLTTELCGKDEYLNIRQSIDNARTYDDLTKYLRFFIDDKIINTNLGLNSSNVVMVFLNARNKRKLRDFVDHFNAANHDLNTLIINGDETTNREAEAKTKEVLDLMKKNDDGRKLVLFSMGMASRSFSIPEIRRVLIVNDGFITPTFLQSSSRCLTYDTKLKGNQEADIIRISFERCDIGPEIFMLENEICAYDDLTYERVERFRNLSSFVTVVLHNDDELLVNTLTNNSVTNMEFIDRLVKFADTTKYIVSKLFGEGIEVDVVGTKTQKSAGKTANTSTTNVKLPSTKAGKVKISKEDEAALATYVNIIRTLPYIPHVVDVKVKNLEELIALDWSFIDISKDIFVKNLENPSFRDQVDAIFRAAEKADDVQIRGRIIEYMEMT